jgi:predicted DNA-binding transcriptional regulator AlpA
MPAKTEIPPLATPDEFCAFAGITPAHAAQLRYTGAGPKFVKISGRQIRYRWSDIENWVDSQTRSRTDGARAVRCES